MTDNIDIFTIGHSTHEIDALVGLVQDIGVTAIADVRSIPASKFAPQFNRRPLRDSLRKAGIEYVFLGRELGARSSDPNCYVDGRVQYARLAASSTFKEGILRLQKGAMTERISLLCTEQEPLDCHRTVLVSRVLSGKGLRMSHVHGDGSLESHEAAMLRLRKKWGLADLDLLRSEEEMTSEALRLQEERIAYVDKSWGRTA